MPPILEATDNLSLSATPSPVLNFWQPSAIALSRLVGRYIFQMRVRTELRPIDLKPGTAYIISANHQSRIDPFMVTGALPKYSLSSLRPIRYLSHNGLFRHWLLRMILLALGCFPTRQNDRYAYGLDAATAFLAAGETVFIFPEGRRTLRGETMAKPGVARLAQQPGVEIIPVRLQWTNRGRRRFLAMTIGRPFKGSRLSAQAILERSYTLELPL